MTYFNHYLILISVMKWELNNDVNKDLNNDLNPYLNPDRRQGNATEGKEMQQIMSPSY